jgi:hypothetical protein
MLQRQIIKAVGNQIDIEYPAYIKYAGTSFHFLDCMLISVNVTIYRTISLPESYENNHCITTTKPLWSCA